MSGIEALILGIAQGLTEFIPVSSSGHLILLHRAMGITDHGLTFDVALHLGTLLALLFYFSKDIWELILGLLGKNNRQRLAWLLVMATIPAAIIGYLLESAAESKFRSARLVSINLIVFALVMLAAERFAQKHKHKSSFEKISTNQGLIMGFAQAAAVVPGVSRSGATITAGLFSGLDRIAATRFSFLLAIPITAGAILKVLVSKQGLATFSSEKGLFAIGIISALLSGLFAIRFLLNYLSKHSLAVFAYYRIALGLLVLLSVR
ncbi:MAG: undecaprenol kinase [Candidatus Saccharibacteria bacterium]|nr:undecaprenol kinase [Candidatus Saccharibacteria bacterium]